MAAFAPATGAPGMPPPAFPPPPMAAPPSKHSGFPTILTGYCLTRPELAQRQLEEEVPLRSEADIEIDDEGQGIYGDASARGKGQLSSLNQKW
eukprot:1024420-Rhodomonas_salina.1